MLKKVNIFKVLFLTLIQFSWILLPAFSKENASKKDDFLLSTPSFNYFLTEKSTIPERNRREIPISVKYFIDESETFTENTIPEENFKRCTASFNPGFYSGALWLEIVFPCSETENHECQFLLGDEHLDYAELYVKKGRLFTFQGRTGRCIPLSKITNPHFINSLQINQKVFNKEDFHTIRVKTASYTGNQISLKLLPGRNFDVYLTQQSMLNFIFLGLFFTVTLILFAIGISTKDSIIFMLASASFFHILIQLHLKGIGQLYIWNFLASKTHSPRLLYIFTTIFLLIITLCLTLIIRKNNHNEKGEFWVPVNFIFAFTVLIFCVLDENKTRTYIVFTLSAIAMRFVLMFEIFLNLKKKNCPDYYATLFWLPGLFVHEVLNLFSILRTQNANPAFNFLIPYTSFILNIDFLLITIPPLCIFLKHIYDKFKMLREKNFFTENTNELLLENQKFKDDILNKIYLAGNTIRSSADILKSNLNYASKEKFLDVINENSLRIVEYISAIKFVENSQELKKSPVDLNLFFESCVKVFLQEFKRKELRVNITSTVPYKTIVEVNKNALQIMFLNFIKYSSLIPGSSSEINFVLLKVEKKFSLTAKIKMKTQDFKRYSKNKELYVFHQEFLEKIAGCFHGNFSFTKNSSNCILSLNISLKEIKKLSAVADELCDTSFKPAQNFSSDSNSKNSILIIEDNFSSQKFYAELFASRFNVTVVCSFSDALVFLEKQNENLTLILSTGNFSTEEISDFTKTISRKNILDHIPFFATISEEEINFTLYLLEKGVDFCFVRPVEITNLFSVIEAVSIAKGKKYFRKADEENLNTEDKTYAALENFSLTENVTHGNAEKPSVDLDRFDLTRREKEIVLLIMDNKSDKEIAAILSISNGTVASHNKKIFRKLQVHSRVELINKVR